VDIASDCVEQARGNIENILKTILYKCRDLQQEALQTLTGLLDLVVEEVDEAVNKAVEV
jgi:hypothetical protein